MSRRVPRRVDAATKAGLLDLVDETVEAGWTIRRVCAVLELGEVRAHAGSPADPWAGSSTGLRAGPRRMTPP